MITFVVYASERKEGDMLNEVIARFLFAKKDHYDILTFDKFSLDIDKKISKLEGVKIFILDTDVQTLSGIEVAKQIRRNGDFVSPIILLTGNRNLDINDLNNVLYLSLILKSRTIAKDIIFSLKEAYKIATKYSVLSFTYFDELYRLPYDEICYVEKDLNCNSVTIHSLDDTYQNYISIRELQSRLKDDPRFYKSHRSCIINIYNVASYDKKNNKIIFKNNETTDLIARSKKNMLIKRIEEISGVVKKEV